ncbi:MAG: hypothetical protein NVS9B4_27430 [Candidatus Acidiferrum sp.]
MAISLRLAANSFRIGLVFVMALRNANTYISSAGATQAAARFYLFVFLFKDETTLAGEARTKKTYPRSGRSSKKKRSVGIVSATRELLQKRIWR